MSAPFSPGQPWSSGALDGEPAAWFPVGYVLPASPLPVSPFALDVAHALDGDRSPVCGAAPPARTVAVAALMWPDVPTAWRCAECRVWLLGVGVGDC